MTALDTARNFQNLMDTASFGTTFGPSIRGCEARATAAMKVCCYLTDSGYFGGPPPTHEEALKHAARAWPGGVPADVVEALKRHAARRNKRGVTLS